MNGPKTGPQHQTGPIVGSVLGAAMFIRDRIMWLPLPKSAAAFVSINGRCYAGFHTAHDALEARRLWLKHWPAVVGCKVEVEVSGR